MARHDVPFLEQVLGAIGAVVFAGTLGFLAYQALLERPRDPDLQVQLEGVELRSGRHVATVRVTNAGNGAAQNVAISGRLEGAGQQEVSEMTLDFVPARSSRNAKLLFSRDPKQHQLALRVEGYQEP